MSTAPWLGIVPGAAIFVSVLGFNLLTTLNTKVDLFLSDVGPLPVTALVVSASSSVVLVSTGLCNEL